MIPRSILRGNQRLQPVCFVSVSRRKYTSGKLRLSLQNSQVRSQRSRQYPVLSHYFSSSSLVSPIFSHSPDSNERVHKSKDHVKCLSDLAVYIETNHPSLPIDKGLPLQQESLIDYLSKIPSEQYITVSTSDLLTLLHILTALPSLEMGKAHLIVRNIISSIQLGNRSDPIGDLEISEILHIAGNLGYDYKQLSSKDRKSILQLVSSLKSDGVIASSFQRYIHFLNALRKIHLDWRDLPNSHRRELFSILSTFQNLSYSTVELFDIHLFMQAVTELSILRVDRPSPEVAETFLPLVIYALTAPPNPLSPHIESTPIKLGYCASHFLSNGAVLGRDLDEDLFHHLFAAIQCDIPRLDLIEIGLLMTSLGEMKIKHHQIPTTTWWQLLESIQSHLNDGSSPSISMNTLAIILTGWRKLDCQWNDFFDSLQMTVLATIRYCILSECEDRKKLPSHQHKGFCRLISYLGQLSIDWKQIPVPAKKALYRGIICYSPSCDELTLSLLLTGLAKMRLRYQDLPENIQLQLFASLEKRIPRMTGMMIIHLLQSFQDMQLPWKTLPISIQKKVLQQIPHISNCPVSSDVILALIQGYISEADKQSLRKDLIMKEVVLTILSARFGDHYDVKSAENVKVIPSLLQRLGKSGIVWSSLPASVQTTLLDGVDHCTQLPRSLSERDVSNLFGGLGAIEEEFILLNHDRITKILQALSPFLDQELPHEVPTTEYIVNIVSTLCQLPYSWCHHFPSESRVTLLSHLKRVIPYLSDQDLVQLMYCFVFLSYYPPINTTELFAVHQPLLQNLSLVISDHNNLWKERKRIFSHELAVYFNWLLTLPLESQQSLLCSLSADQFLSEVLPKRDPYLHSKIASKLLKVFEEERFADHGNFQVKINYLGCKVPKYVMDLAITTKQQDNVDKYTAFVEFQWPKPKYQKFELRRMEAREADLKQYLYAYHHPLVPIWKIVMPEDTTTKMTRVDTVVKEILQKLKL